MTDIARDQRDDSLVCQFCWQGSEVENIAGHLHAEKTESGKLISAHHRCMQYASGLTQYKCQIFGGFDIAEVEKEIARGSKLRCFICKGSRGRKCKGASCGCAVKYCRKSFHFTCASDHPVAVTKRLVVTKDKHNPDEKFVLYRVFCSPDHELAFRKLLKNDLRGATRKKQTKSTENHTDDDGCATTEQSLEPDSTSDDKVMVASPGANDSGSSSQLSQSPLNMSAPELSSTLISENLDDDETNDGPTTTHENDSMSSSSSMELDKSPTPESQPQDPAADISQPDPSQRSVESSDAHQDSVLHGLGKEDRSCGHIMDILKTQSDRLSTGADSLAASSGEESTENKSPNIQPEVAKTLAKFTKALTDCLNVEKGLLHTNLSEKGSKSKRLRLEKNVENNPDNEVGMNPKRALHKTAGLSPVKSRPLNKLSLANNSPKPGNVAIDQTTPSQNSDSTLCSGGSENVACETASVDTTPLKPATSNDPSELGKETLSSNSESVHVFNADTSVGSGQQQLLTPLRSTSLCKRKKSELESDPREDEPCRKVSKHCVQSAFKLQEPECILLVPSNMEEFQQQESEVTEKASSLLKVAVDQVFVWQKITLKCLPSPLLLFFLLDLVKELENRNNEAVVDLLFDGDCLSSKLNNYLITQAQLLVTSDEEGQKAIQASLWSSLQRSVGRVSTLHLIHSNNDLHTLAFDVRLFALHTQVTANIQAYKGLFGWSQDMEAETFSLSPSQQRLAVQAESLALKVWLTKVNPITEVTLLPADELLLDKAKSVVNEEIFNLASCLREKTHAAILMEDAGGSPIQRVVPLLVFQPVEVFTLNFQEYFQKACQNFFQSRGLVSVLALMPLSNLYSSRCESIAGLLKRVSEKEQYRVSVYSAFCPTTHPTSMVLLEVTHQQSVEPVVQLSEISSQSATDDKPKRKRGRPKKSL